MVGGDIFVDKKCFFNSAEGDIIKEGGLVGVVLILRSLSWRSTLPPLGLVRVSRCRLCRHDTHPKKKVKLVSW